MVLVVGAVVWLAPSVAVGQESSEEPAPESGEGRTGGEEEGEADEPVELARPGDDEQEKSAEAGGEGTKKSEGASGEQTTKRGALAIPEVEVVGEEQEEVEQHPGAAEVVTEEELDNQVPLNTNEAIRMIPGVHAQPEEGMGLRQNIGIRGLNPTRSRKVHVMEDGVPIALAPYGEPEMYYSPPVERMSRIEVVKGSGSILYGPQTIGGVINYITPQPPEDFTVTSEARAGTYGYYQGELTVGDTKGDVGYWLNGMHQRFQGPRDLNLELTDVTTKFTFDIGATQKVSVKLNYYDEWSRSTYLGLTTPQYEANPWANYASNDRFKIRRLGAQITHVAVPTDWLVLETRLYTHNIQRNWRRQDFDRRPTCQQQDCYVRVIDGQGRNVPNDESEWPNDRSGIFFRNSTGNRNREFTVGGLEPRATIFADFGPVDYELKTGFRLHIEETRERRINGNHSTSPSGTIRDDDLRVGRAIAAYALNKFEMLDEDLEVSPGLRFESLWTERTIYRTRVQGEPTDLDPYGNNTNHIMALIPGLGVSYNFIEPLTAFGGVHRGFAPPRTKDAITKEGERLKLEPEFSWNYELGVRANIEKWLSAEATAFILDFQNQIIAPAESGGAVSVDPEATDPGTLTAVQGGQTLHRGFEFGATYDLGKMTGAGFDLPISVNYTFVDARFQDGWKTSIRGNQLPYSPRHRLAGRVGFFHPSGLKVQVDGDWLSGQYTDKVETVQPNRAGLIGWIGSRFLLDANVQYTFQPWGLTGFVAAKNLLNEKYIASRAPRGIKPGMPRHVYAGLRWRAK